MTGIEHFKAGEQLLAKSEDMSSNGKDLELARTWAQQAQAHFMAAQAMATIDSGFAVAAEAEDAFSLRKRWEIPKRG